MKRTVRLASSSDFTGQGEAAATSGCTSPSDKPIAAILCGRRQASSGQRPNLAASVVPAAAAPAPPTHAGRFAFRDRGRQGLSYQSRFNLKSGNTVAGEPAKDSEDKEAENVVENVRVIGRKTFYRRGDHWVDSAVTAEQEQKPNKVERYGKEYFELVDKYGHDAAKYLTFDEPVIVELGGKAYSF